MARPRSQSMRRSLELFPTYCQSRSISLRRARDVPRQPLCWQAATRGSGSASDGQTQGETAAHARAAKQRACVGVRKVLAAPEKVTCPERRADRPSGVLDVLTAVEGSLDALDGGAAGAEVLDF